MDHQCLRTTSLWINSSRGITSMRNYQHLSRLWFEDTYICNVAVTLQWIVIVTIAAHTSAVSIFCLRFALVFRTDIYDIDFMILWVAITRFIISVLQLFVLGFRYGVKELFIVKIIMQNLAHIDNYFKTMFLISLCFQHYRNNAVNFMVRRWQNGSNMRLPVLWYLLWSLYLRWTRFQHHQHIITGKFLFL